MYANPSYESRRSKGNQLLFVRPLEIVCNTTTVEAFHLSRNVDLVHLHQQETYQGRYIHADRHDYMCQSFRLRRWEPTVMISDQGRMMFQDGLRPVNKQELSEGLPSSCVESGPASIQQLSATAE